MCSSATTIDAAAERAAARVGLPNDARAHRGSRPHRDHQGRRDHARKQSCLPNTEWLLASMRATPAAATREHGRGSES